jgi:hypothetical protein
MLVPALIILLVLFPVLLPAAITAVHVILGTNRPAATLRYPRPAAA